MYLLAWKVCSQTYSVSIAASYTAPPSYCNIIIGSAAIRKPPLHATEYS